MNSSTNPGGLTRDSVAQQIDGPVKKALTEADGASADRVQNLSLVHQARVSRLTRTAARVTAQQGANSTQAAAAQNAVIAGNTTVARIQVLHRQVSTAAPPVAATGWTLHGRVYNAQLQPVSGYTVFLVDSQKTYLSAYGFAYTDSTGYFLINFAGKTPSPPESSTEGLFVQIANSSAKPVYLSAAAFQPRLGSAAYQNITLPPGEPVLGDLPEEIRKVALPSEKSGS